MVLVFMSASYFIVIEQSCNITIIFVHFPLWKTLFLVWKIKHYSDKMPALVEHSRKVVQHFQRFKLLSFFCSVVFDQVFTVSLFVLHVFLVLCFDQVFTISLFVLHVFLVLCFAQVFCQWVWDEDEQGRAVKYGWMMVGSHTLVSLGITRKSSHYRLGVALLPWKDHDTSESMRH